MLNYKEIVMGDLPEDFRLTIYYMDPWIFTRMPLSVDDLMNDSLVVKIEVSPEELAEHTALLQKLDASKLQPVEEETYIDARLYYVFESDDTGKVLEVVTRSAYDTVFVNGIEVENNSVFFEVILPFLSEEDRSILEI